MDAPLFYIFDIERDPYPVKKKDWQNAGFPKSVGHVGHVWRFKKMSDEHFLGRQT